MKIDQAKIYHHHTPRQYLLPWADSSERVAWSGYGKVERSGLTVVGGEDNFYKLKELTIPDIGNMKLVIGAFPEAGRGSHKRFLQRYVLPTRLKRYLEQRGDDSSQAMKLVDTVRSNFMEDYYASIERSFWPYLEFIKARNYDFIGDNDRAIEFFHGLAVQYMRTKAAKERALQRSTFLFEDIERVWDVLSYILAVELGRSFFMNRENYKILVLDNYTQVPFITSDQPIVNIRANAGSYEPPDKIELYYPLGPAKAMLYLEKSTPVGGITQSVSIDEAHSYNKTMLDHSAFRIFSNSEAYLRLLQKR